MDVGYNTTSTTNKDLIWVTTYKLSVTMGLQTYNTLAFTWYNFSESIILRRVESYVSCMSLYDLVHVFKMGKYCEK